MKLVFTPKSYLPSLEACCDGRKSLHGQEPVHASFLATKMKARSRFTVKNSLTSCRRDLKALSSIEGSEQRWAVL